MISEIAYREGSTSNANTLLRSVLHRKAFFPELARYIYVTIHGSKPNLPTESLEEAPACCNLLFSCSAMSKAGLREEVKPLVSPQSRLSGAKDARNDGHCSQMFLWLHQGAA
jgi:hypothetical protein